MSFYIFGDTMKTLIQLVHRNKASGHKFVTIPKGEDINEGKTIRALIKDKFDVVLILDGREGGGKTTFGCQLCKLIDPTFDLDRVVFDAEEFYKCANTLPPGSALLMDESMNVLFSRAAMSSTNIGMVRMLAMCRAKRLFIVLIIPTSRLIL